MVSTANQQAYGQSPWGSGPQYPGNPSYAPPFWHPAGLSRPLGIVAMILGFVFFWPIGLALLFFMKWSGHMGCWGRRHQAQWGGNESTGGWQGPFQGWAPWKAWNAQANTSQPQATPASGNRAFEVCVAAPQLLRACPCRTCRQTRWQRACKLNGHISFLKILFCEFLKVLIVDA